jgi:hypothetical protein
MRDIKEFFGVVFKVVTDEEKRTTTLSAMGVGFGNLGKKVG